MKIGNARGQRVYECHIASALCQNTPEYINTHMQNCMLMPRYFAKSHETVMFIAYSAGPRLRRSGSLGMLPLGSMCADHSDK